MQLAWGMYRVLEHWLGGLSVVSTFKSSRCRKGMGTPWLGHPTFGSGLELMCRGRKRKKNISFSLLSNLDTCFYSFFRVDFYDHFKIQSQLTLTSKKKYFK